MTRSYIKLTAFKRQSTKLFIQWIVVQTHGTGSCHGQSEVKKKNVLVTEALLRK